MTLDFERTTMRAPRNVRRLRPEDLDSLRVLRQEALTNEPLAFGSSPADDRMRSVEFVRGVLADELEQAVFGCFERDQLIGMIGVIRESGSKERHKARLWGAYVAPKARRMGAGRALLAAAVERARGWTGVERLQLSVTESSVAAKSLYEASGFRLWGREPRALAWKGRFVDELYLVLEFSSSR
jgi:ribosomal protein S18 acetylase RimI-like enzyme